MNPQPAIFSATSRAKQGARSVVMAAGSLETRWFHYVVRDHVPRPDGFVIG